MTKQQELEILTNYEPLLKKTVYNFIQRCNVRTLSAEDLMQEARMAFLQHIRTHKPEEYGRCRFTILHALCDAVLRQYPVSMPRAVFFDRGKREQWVMVNLDDEVQYEARNGGYDAADLAAQIMDVVGTLPEEAMKLVKLKLERYSNREAAQKLGMTDVQVSRMLKQIRRLLEDDAA